MPSAMLVFSDGDGEHMVVLDHASTSIGRSPSQDVVLRDAAVSRQHAAIELDGGTYLVVDRHSTHGTFLNGVRVERAVLEPGDVLQMGSLKGPQLRFQLHNLDTTTGSARDDSATDLFLSLKDSLHPPGETKTAAREMEQLNWLLRAARQLNEGVAIEDILGVLLKLTLQLTGEERGFVFLCKEGQMRFAQGLGEQGKIVEEDSTISRHAMQNAIDSESKFQVSDTMADKSVSEWSSVLENKIRSICCIPLRKRGAANEPVRLLGLLYLDSRIRPGYLTQVDHQLLDTIATEAAALVHNALLAEEEQKARQMREELAFAARIHQGLMSDTLPAIPYAALRARSIPCLAIGGDFYDVVALDDCACVTVVDVSGKGVSAAIVAAALQGIIHAQLLAGQSLPQIAAMANRFLCARDVGKYATMVVLRLFPEGRFEYLNCGHIPPIAVLGDEIRRLEESNLVVGLLEGAGYCSAFGTLRPGERILLVTDGITEAENPAGDLFGDAGLCAFAHLDDIDAILDIVARFQAPNPAQDDITLIDVRYTGKG
jgi:phosphoserine phosphatase RsbU/P